MAERVVVGFLPPDLDLGAICPGWVDDGCGG